MKLNQSKLSAKAPQWAANIAVIVMSLCLAASGGLLSLSFVSYKESLSRTVTSVPSAVFLNRSGHCGEPIYLTNDNTNLFLIKGLLNGHEVSFLFDTGASNTIIPGHLAEKLLIDSKQRQSHVETIRTLNGDMLATQVKAQKIEIGGNSFLADVLVVPSPSNELILGMDVIPLFTTTIDSSGLKLVIPC